MGTTVEERLAELEAEVRRLRDIEEIKQLQARFWLACDGDVRYGPTHLPEAIVELFTEDGSWGPLQVAGDDDPDAMAFPRGRDELLEYFRGTQERVPFAMHFGAAPLIEVDGDDATGKWKLMGTMTTAAQNALLAAAIYHTTYRRTPDGWRIRSSRLVLGFNTPWEDGWAKTKYATLVRNADAPA